MTHTQNFLNIKANQVRKTKDKKDKMDLIKRIHVCWAKEGFITWHGKEL
jgi:hypothetical protein